MNNQSGERIASGILVLVCFAVLSWLNGRYAASGAGDIALFTILGLCLSVLGLAALTGIVLVCDPALRRAGFTGAAGAVARGYLTVIPFTVLGLLAELVFKWHAAPAFLQAAIMTSGAAVGMEVARLAGRSKIRFMIACTGGGFAFSMAWILSSSLFSKAVG